MSGEPAEDLDALIKRVDPDRWLATRFIGDQEKRADVIAVYAFDYELRRAVEATTNPITAEIRLTWWSEALDEIYSGGTVRRHPVVDALTRVVARRGLARGPLDEALDSRSAGMDTAPAVAEAAGLVLDPDVDRTALRRAAAGDRGSARSVSAAAFPALAHLAARGRSDQLRKRLHLTWAVVSGRL